jgi:hypothetical protein
MFMSHAGGEDEVYQDVLKTFVSRRYVLPERSAKVADHHICRKQVDYQQRKMCVQACINAWRKQIDILTNAYLGWRFKGCQSVEADVNTAWPLKTIDFFSGWIHLVITLVMLIEYFRSCSEIFCS